MPFLVLLMHLMTVIDLRISDCGMSLYFAQAEIKIMAFEIMLIIYSFSSIL